MSGFSVDVSGRTNGYLVRLTGRAGGPESEQLEEQLNRLVKLNPAVIVLDLSGLEFLSSMGLSALIRLHRSMKDSGGSARLAAVPADIVKLLQSVRLDSLVPIYSTPDEAFN